MNSKIIAIFAVILILMPILVSAAPERTGFSSANGILGGTETGILNTVINIINFPVPIISAKLYGFDVAKEGTAPLWLLFAIFAIVYSVIWLASGFIKLFKDDANRTTRIFFTIGITVITMFATPMMMYILNLINIFASLAKIAILVVGVFLVWVLSRSAWASGVATNAESSKSMAEAAELSAQAARQRGIAKEDKRKVTMALDNGVKKQRKAIRSLRSDLEKVLRDLIAVKNGRTTSRLGRNLEKRVLRDMSQISTDLGKILTFKSENDRVMTGMRSADFVPKRNAGLPGNATGTGRVLLDAEKELSTETNDLGRILSELANTIKSQGIITSPPPGNINKLVSLAENAVNVSARMERDIITEEQMIDKI